MADVLVGIERWPSNRTDRCSPTPRPLPSPGDDRCRRVVAIRDDILLRLEQRMRTPRRPNVRKFHYAFQSVREASTKRVTRDAAIVNAHTLAHQCESTEFLPFVHTIRVYIYIIEESRNYLNGTRKVVVVSRLGLMKGSAIIRLTFRSVKQ